VKRSAVNREAAEFWESFKKLRKAEDLRSDTRGCTRLSFSDTSGRVACGILWDPVGSCGILWVVMLLHVASCCFTAPQGLSAEVNRSQLYQYIDIEDEVWSMYGQCMVNVWSM